MGGDDESPSEASYSIVIDDPEGARMRAPTDTVTPAPPRRVAPPEVIVRRVAREPDDRPTHSVPPGVPEDTGPLVILRERTVIDRDETPPFAEPGLDTADTPTAPVPAHRSGPFGPPIPVEGGPLPRGHSGAGAGRRAPPREPSRPRPGARPVRDYPVLRALVRDPDAHHDERATSTAVPRAFVRAGPTHERPSSARADVDGMLEEMAEGLLVGGDGAGNSEIRVTLGEEFFGGTELRIQRTAEGVTAILRPPDRDTYRVLAAELPRLRVHLEERGLRVSNLRVEEP